LLFAGSKGKGKGKMVTSPPESYETHLITSPLSPTSSASLLYPITPLVGKSSRKASNDQLIELPPSSPLLSLASSSSSSAPMTVPAHILNSMTPGVPSIPVTRKGTGNISNLLSTFKLLDDDDVTPLELVERAKQEALIQQRIFELKSQGFLNKTVPKKPEPVPRRAHWDYLIQEVSMVAGAMMQERRQRIFFAKKNSKGILKHFELEKEKESKLEKEEEKRLRRIASSIAKDVMR